jgi:hypothetical protein
VLAKRFFALKENFEVPPDQAPGRRIQHDGVPVILGSQAGLTILCFQMSLSLVLYLLHQQKNFGRTVPVRNEPVLP